MREFQGYIEIVHEDEHHIIAKVTSEGRALLDCLRAEQDSEPG
jgi:hypothetical protein